MKPVTLGVLAVLVAAALALPLVQKLRPQADLAGPKARVKAWWTMALIFLAVNRIMPLLHQPAS